MAIHWLTLFFDNPRPTARAAETFWLQVTRSTLSARRGEFATLVPESGDPYLRIQEIDSDIAGCHLDVHVDDVRREADRAVRLGASVVADRETLVWLRSPGGLNTCIVRHDGAATVPSPIRWPDGQRSIIDQICIDAPARSFDNEARFWAAFTGWARRPGTMPEFAHLVRQPEMPLRLLFQRLGERTGTVRAHADLACDGVAAEIERHRRLGASFVRETDEWTTLRDPADRDYCITARIP
jgi:hypothetical protein